MTPGVCVMMRGSPFSAGTVRISPRASNSARVAFGDRCALESRALTFTIRARTSGKSPAIRTGTGFNVPVFTSNSASPPNCSTTMASAAPPIDLKSKPELFFASSFTCFERVSYEKSETAPLRSLRK